jgi:hypothetical protein
MSEGFYKRRRGILEHLEAGTIGFLELAIHDYLNLRANLVIGSRSSLPAGVCKTSAAAIRAICRSQFSEKSIQRSLAHLEKIGWIKRWNVRGKRGNYPVLICRASVHDWSGKEYRVNGEETTDWRLPKYMPVSDLSVKRDSADQSLSGDREGRRKEKRKEKRSTSTPAPEIGASMELPDWLPLETWNEFLQARKLQRTPVTTAAIPLLIKQLEDFMVAGNDPKAVLEQSIMNGYRGLFEVS